MILAGCCAALPPAWSAAAPLRRGGNGFNLIQQPHAPLGSEAARRSFEGIRATGADMVALIPFLWQANAASPAIALGSDMSAAQLAAGIRQARDAGLRVMVKPHVWVPGGWAGQVRMADDAGWRAWFEGYRAAIVMLAGIAAKGGASWFSVGTELREAAARPEWEGLIGRVRQAFDGGLLYVAHGADDAERVPFWSRLDAVGATLYPALGRDDDEAGWGLAMRGEIDRLAKVAAQVARPVWIAELGIRSAVGAAEKPWESAEERAAAPDQELQSRVLAAWLEALGPLDPLGILVWRWFSGPASGGAADTDFTVQGKAAAAMLARRWRVRSGTTAR